MKKKILLLTIAAVTVATTDLEAQDTTRWSLSDCIRYAMDHSIDIKSRQKETENAEIDLSTSRNSLLPNLNASVSQNFDFGRATSNTGVIVDQSAANTGLSIGASVNLFNGFRSVNDIRSREYSLQAATQNLEQARQDIALNVSAAFLNTLLNKQLEGVAQLQLDITEQTVNKTESLVAVGKRPQSQLLEARAQYSRDAVSLIEAKNNTRTSLLTLVQLIEWQGNPEQFLIADPNLGEGIDNFIGSIKDPQAIYAEAQQNRAIIKSHELTLQSLQHSLKSAKGQYAPTLDLGASYSNGYYHYFNNSNIPNPSFGTQFRQNGRESIGLTLSIPIFNRFVTRNSVKSAKVAITLQELRLETSRKTLFKEIQQAYTNATGSLERFNASKTALESSKIAFESTQQRYDAGKSTQFELNDAKLKYMQALSSLTQARFDFIFRAKILDFYRGIPIQFEEIEQSAN